MSAEHFDHAMASLLEAHALVGGAIAVAKGGRLVFARGYGAATTAGPTGSVRWEPSRPDQTFLVASVSKPITSVAVMRLVEQGKLGLDDLVIDRLGGLWERGALADNRLATITVRHVLYHRAGWPGTDVIPSAALAALGRSGASDPRAIVRFMAQRPLGTVPGATYAYSNFGYVVLGRVIEHVTGRSYEEAVMDLVLGPAGATGARLASAPLAPLAAGYDAAAGWEMSPIDLVRFALAIDGRRPPALLNRETRRLVETPATAADAPSLVRDWRLWRFPRSHNGPGWGILPSRLWWLGRRPVLWSHVGALPKGCALLLRGAPKSSYTVAAAFTGLPRGGHEKVKELVRPIARAVFAVREWPRGDLFDTYR